MTWPDRTGALLNDEDQISRLGPDKRRTILEAKSYSFDSLHASDLAEHETSRWHTASSEGHRVGSTVRLSSATVSVWAVGHVFRNLPVIDAPIGGSVSLEWEEDIYVDEDYSSPCSSIFELSRVGCR